VVHGANLFQRFLIHRAGNEQPIDETGVVQQTLADLFFQQRISQDSVLSAGFQGSGERPTLCLGLAHELAAQPLPFRKGIDGDQDEKQNHRCQKVAG
jgi:hypothetical protein